MLIILHSSYGKKYNYVLVALHNIYVLDVSHLSPPLGVILSIKFSLKPWLSASVFCLMPMLCRLTINIMLAQNDSLSELFVIFFRDRSIQCHAAGFWLLWPRTPRTEGSSTWGLRFFYVLFLSYWYLISAHWSRQPACSCPIPANI